MPEEDPHERKVSRWRLSGAAKTCVDRETELSRDPRTHSVFTRTGDAMSPAVGDTERVERRREPPAALARGETIPRSRPRLTALALLMVAAPPVLGVAATASSATFAAQADSFDCQLVEDLEDFPPEGELPFEDEPVDEEFFAFLEWGGTDDQVECGDDNDQIDAGAGDDHVKGAGGDDVLHGGPGVDDLDGGSGTDDVYGDPGNDSLHGGAGSDDLLGVPDADDLEGGAGRDTLTGEAGGDTLSGGAGNDTMAKDGKRDVVRCGAGRDTVRADRKDTLVGCEVVRRR